MKRGVFRELRSALEYIRCQWSVGHKPGLSHPHSAGGLGDHKLRFQHGNCQQQGSTAAMLASCLQAAGYRNWACTLRLPRLDFRQAHSGKRRADGPDDALVRLVERVRPAATPWLTSTGIRDHHGPGDALVRRKKNATSWCWKWASAVYAGLSQRHRPARVRVITALGMDRRQKNSALLHRGHRAPKPVASSSRAVRSGELRRCAGSGRCHRPCGQGQNAPLTVVDTLRLKVEGGDLDAVTFDAATGWTVSICLIGSYQPKNAASLSRALRAAGQGMEHLRQRHPRPRAGELAGAGSKLLRHSPAFLLDPAVHNAHPGCGPPSRPPGTASRGEVRLSAQHHSRVKDVDGCWHCCCRWQRFVTVMAHTPPRHAR